MSESFHILYPESFPGGTVETLLEVDGSFPAGTIVQRQIYRDLQAVPAEIANSTHALMIYKFYVTDIELAHFPNLRVIVRLGVGTERVDLVAAEKRGVTVHNVPDYGTYVVAFHALSLIMGLDRNLSLRNHMFCSSDVIPWDATTTIPARQADEGTLGIVGFGRIGSQLGKLAAGLGYKVMYYDINPDCAIVPGCTRVAMLEELLSRSTRLSLNVPDTPLTRNMISTKQIDLLPAGATIVNTGRGRVLDPDALYDGLRSGHLRGAGLDVWFTEPPAVSDLHPLLRAFRNQEPWIIGRLDITGHSASHSDSASKNIHIKSADTVIKALRGDQEVFRVRPGQF
ncbi:phosphoglycerate dehydrogenase [Clavulina sp. PMI_390]|nr:phosphoglycerate dehydrogenase [Clavulina sp. PMI_390]